MTEVPGRVEGRRRRFRETSVRGRVTADLTRWDGLSIYEEKNSVESREDPSLRW